MGTGLVRVVTQQEAMQAMPGSFAMERRCLSIPVRTGMSRGLGNQAKNRGHEDNTRELKLHVHILANLKSENKARPQVFHPLSLSETYFPPH